MKQLLRFAILVALVSVSVPACDDSSSVSTHDGGNGDLHGQVYSMTDSTLIEGAMVSLVDAIPYRVVAGPVKTDASGRYVFQDVPPGDWYLFVISGNHFMFNPASARVSIVPGMSVQRDIRMIRSELWGNGGAKIAGVITDGATGQPVAGAFVSSMLFVFEYSFLGLPVNEAITDANGHYEISASTWITDDGSQVSHPFGVTKEGYRPQFTLFLPIEDASLDTTYTVNAVLESNPFRGAIGGRVRHLTRYVEGIAVGLDYSTWAVNNVAATKTATPRPTSLLGSAVRTDSHGAFLIDGLAPGTYYVDVAFLPDDGFMLSLDDAQSQRILVELGENERLDLGTLQVVRTMRPVYPFNGAVIEDPTPTLRWTSTPGADRYRLSAGTGHMLDFSVETASPAYTLEFPLPPGTSIRWTVRAIRGECPDCETLSSFEAVATFTIAPQ